MHRPHRPRPSRAPATWVLGVALVAGCGGQPDGATDGATDGGPESAAADVAGRPRGRAATGGDAVDGGTSADLLTLLATWRETKEYSDERLAATAAIVARGDAGLAQLIEWLGGEDVTLREAAAELLPAFGAAAVKPLLALLATDDRPLRHQVIVLLGGMASDWAWDADTGPVVCRKLFELLKDPEHREQATATLRLSRPAGRVIAADVAALWRTSSEEDRDALWHLLECLGTDAAPAAPTLVRAMAETIAAGERPGILLVQALAAIGPTDASVLAELRKLLAEGPEESRGDVAGILRTWGEVAGAAAPELVALLHSSDETARDAALRALAAMPSSAAGRWREIVAACTDAEGRYPWAARDLLKDCALRDRSFGGQLAAAFTSLELREMDLVLDVLVESGAFDPARIVPVLVRHEDPWARRLALWPWAWKEDELGHPLPPAVLALLDDPDPSVSAYALLVVADLHAAPPEFIRDAALGLAGSSDAHARRNAVEALRSFAASDPKALDAVIAALDDEDEDVREVALLGLASGDTPIPGKHPEALAWGVGQVTDWSHGLEFARAVLRLEGGVEALAAALPAVLRETVDRNVNRFSRATAVVAAAGPRLAALRPVLMSLREGPGGVDAAQSIDAALGAISGDAEMIALAGPPDATTLARLLALGEAGRAAIPLLACHLGGGEPEEILTPFRAGASATEIAAAARAAPPDPHAIRRREGAAVLAPLLPPAEACAILAPLVHDADVYTSEAALRSLWAVERRAPGAVPVPLVKSLLTGLRGSDLPLRIAFLLGPRATDIAPDLRRYRDRGPPRVTALAATALWRITKDPDDVLPALRGVLTWRSGHTDGVDWGVVGTVLAELPLTEADIPAIVQRIRDADTRAHLVPLLAQFGPAAASAVSTLRVELASHDGDSGDAMIGAAIARTLGAIGPAARDAVPDLRRWTALTGDPEGAARDAIAKIEAAR